MGKEKIQKQLKKFITRINKTYRPEKVILFGSYARGEATEYSDVDILVVAKKFKNADSYARFSELYDLGKDLDPDFNAIGITPGEVKSMNYMTTIKDALATGVVVG